MTPPRHSSDSLTIADIEVIARRVFSEMRTAIEGQQALMVQEMKNMNQNILKLDETLNSSFVRKESFEPVVQQVNDNKHNIAKAAWAIFGMVLAGIGALLFKS